MSRFVQLLAGVSALAMLGATPVVISAEPAATAKMTPPANDKPKMYELTFGKPFIDVDEWRDTPRRHRYIHGGFENSHLRFSGYFPPKELYKERFLGEYE